MNIKLKSLFNAILFRVVIAIILGIVCGLFMPVSIARIFFTISDIFSSFLSFLIPLIILGLITAAISNLGKGAGGLLLITVVIAYSSTIFSGFLTYFTCESILPNILSSEGVVQEVESISNIDTLIPYFHIDIPPALDVMTSLVLAFCVGICLSSSKGTTIQGVVNDFRDIIIKLIENVIIPILPLFIFGIFLKMTLSGGALSIMDMFMKVVVVVLVLHVLLLLFQYLIAGLVTGKNPLILLKNMLPAYFTALGTSSSAATIPVTLNQAMKNGVNQSIASFTVPLCATIHLAGSMLKIVAFSMAVMYVSDMPISLSSYSGFIFMLAIVMIAAPGVPGGAIMAAIGVLQSILGFDESMIALMITLYIALDSFGTACNVTGDGAIALVVNQIAKKKDIKEQALPE